MYLIENSSLIQSFVQDTMQSVVQDTRHASVIRSVLTRTALSVFATTTGAQLFFPDTDFFLGIRVDQSTMIERLKDTIPSLQKQLRHHLTRDMTMILMGILTDEIPLMTGPEDFCIVLGHMLAFIILSSINPNMKKDLEQVWETYDTAVNTSLAHIILPLRNTILLSFNEESITKFAEEFENMVNVLREYEEGEEEGEEESEEESE